MIARLRGTLVEIQPPWLLIDVNGVGYQVEATMPTFYGELSLGQEIIIHTHMVVREDAQLLYGFLDTFERALFKELIRVSGVGPKTALSILSGIEAGRLVRCLEDSDANSLTKVPGIGKKTAERLIIELKDRVKKLEGAAAHLPGLLSPTSLPSAPVQDAVAALEALGYKTKAAETAVAKVDAEGRDSATIIRLALQQLAGR